ncbi:MAG: plasmid stabilization protein [Wenzhouxiangella sp.]|nr:MAG: plasmid stabilization protein [Wenzhouxiangella sp.]
MTEPQLSVRSAKARELAYRLASRERRTIAAIVERALEEYEQRHSEQTPPGEFYRDLQASCSSDVDLDAVLEDHRAPHHGIKL